MRKLRKDLYRMSDIELELLVTETDWFGPGRIHIKDARLLRAILREIDRRHKNDRKPHIRFHIESVLRAVSYK